MRALGTVQRAPERDVDEQPSTRPFNGKTVPGPS